MKISTILDYKTGLPQKMMAYKSGQTVSPSMGKYGEPVMLVFQNDLPPMVIMTIIT